MSLGGPSVPNDYVSCVEEARGGGFAFENFRRNEKLLQCAREGKRPAFPGEGEPVRNGPPAQRRRTISLTGGGRGVLPAPRKTGTTICGVVCGGDKCVVLAADTRATEGPIVADKNCFKLHRISDNIYCAGAGTSADLEHTTAWLESKVELHRMNTNTNPRVSMAVTVLSQELFKYQGYKGCAVVMGGVDFTGPSLYKIHPHGSTDRSPFAAMGSGSLSALAILENGFRDDLSLEDGRALAVSAIRSGIFNDLGSGGNVDVCVIRSTGVAQIVRSFESHNARAFRLPLPVNFPSGTTQYLRQKIELVKQHVTVADEDVVMTEAG